MTRKINNRITKDSSHNMQNTKARTKGKEEKRTRRRSGSIG